MDTLGKDSKILVATFSPWSGGKRSPTNGMVKSFVWYFTKHAGHLDLIDQPHPGSDILLPRIERHVGKRVKLEKSSIFVSWLTPFLLFQNTSGTRISFKLRDFLSVIDWGVRSRKKYDLFIGFESINALAGVALKKFGKVDAVVYYVSDFSPKRYGDSWFNRVYLCLDKMAAKYSDATWNVSPAMPAARKKLGYDLDNMSPQLYAPNAFFKEEIKYLAIGKTKPFSIVYAGTMGPENGPDLAVQAMPEIIKKFSAATLTLAGGGRKEDEQKIKQLIKKLKLEKSVDYRGFIPTNEEMLDIVRQHRISIAPYRALPNSVRWYADAVKVRLSLACGLPIITSQVPPMGHEAQKLGAGIVSKDNPKALAKDVIRIFSDPKLYAKMRKSAIDAAKNNTWENSYSNALRDMGVKV